MYYYIALMDHAETTILGGALVVLVAFASLSMIAWNLAGFILTALNTFYAYIKKTIKNGTLHDHKKRYYKQDSS